MLSEQMPLTARGKHARLRKAENESGEGGATERTVRRASLEANSEGEVNKKELEKIKKKFLNKINNMDITLALPEN
jgi:hypothetical protein